MAWWVIQLITLSAKRSATILPSLDTIATFVQNLFSKETFAQGTVIQGTFVQGDFCPRRHMSKELTMYVGSLYSNLDKSLLGQLSLGQPSPWTIVSLDKSLLGQRFTWKKVSLDKCLIGLMSPWTIVFLGQKSPSEDSRIGLKSHWITFSLDNSPLDNCGNTIVTCTTFASEVFEIMGTWCYVERGLRSCFKVATVTLPRGATDTD